VADSKKEGFVDLLDRTFSLISKTWMTSLTLGAVLFIPTSVMFGWAYGSLFDAVRGTAGMGEGDNISVLKSLGFGYLWIVLAALAQALVFLFVRACVTDHAARAARGEQVKTVDVVVRVITRRYAPLLGQRLLQALILSITLGGVSLVVGIGVGIFAGLKLIVPAAIVGAVLGLAGLCLLIWLSVRFMVTLESMVIDGTRIEQSIDQSMVLVRHRWWRVFGYTLLFGLMVSFASSLIGTPIVFFSTIRQFIRTLQEIMRDTSGSQDFNAVFLRILGGLGRRLGILQYVQSLMAAFVAPVFMTLLFLRLKAEAEPEPAPPAVSAPAESAS